MSRSQCTTCRRLSLSCAAISISIFIQLYLKSVMPVSFFRSLFPCYRCSLVVLVCDVHCNQSINVYYIRQVNGVKLADIMFSLLSVCLCLCAHGCNVPHTIHSKLQTSNLTSTSPGSPDMTPEKIFEKGEWQGHVNPTAANSLGGYMHSPSTF